VGLVGLASSLVGVMSSSARAQPTTALVGGTVVRPAASPPAEDATVVLRGDTIVAVGPASRVDVPRDATVIDVNGQWIVPGLIDGHVHFFQSGGLYTRPDVIDLRSQRSYAEERTRIEERLPSTFARYLRSGITSVVDVGGPMWNLQVRDQADSLDAAPRMLTAGPLLSSVSRPSLVLGGDAPIRKVDTAEEARRRVANQVAAGVDLVKLWWIVPRGKTPAAFRPVAQAAIDAAHADGRRVAVHATQQATAQAAVDAGADILVHSVFDTRVADAFVEQLRERRVLYVPTLMVRMRYRAVLSQQLTLTDPEQAWGSPAVIATLDDLQALPDEALPQRVQQMMAADPRIVPNPTALANLKRLHEAGVPIAVGTDAGNIGTLHGPSIIREMDLMVDAGLTPQEVLAAATRGGAQLMDRPDLGRIEPGARADLVVLNSNPLAAVSHLADIARVVAQGRVYAPSDLVDE
jgi:imidazolonepropionase-like amidohydrolase